MMIKTKTKTSLSKAPPALNFYLDSSQLVPSLIREGGERRTMARQSSALACLRNINVENLRLANMYCDFLNRSH